MVQNKFDNIESHISRKWGNILNLFEDHNLFGGCGESGIKMNAQILKWEPFSDKINTDSQKPFYTHKSMHRLVHNSAIMH